MLQIFGMRYFYVDLGSEACLWNLVFVMDRHRERSSETFRSGILPTCDCIMSLGIDGVPALQSLLPSVVLPHVHLTLRV